MLRVGIKNRNSVLFFCLVWAFFALNSKALIIPYVHILRWVLLILLIVAAARIANWRIPKAPREIILFLPAVLPSVIWSKDKLESVEKILSFVVVFWGCYIFFSSLNDLTDMETAVKLVTVVIVAFELQSIVAVISGNGTMFGNARLSGITTNPNTLGGYSNLAFLAAGYWAYKTKGAKRLFFWLLMGCAVALVVVSQSKMSFAILAVNIAALLFVQSGWIGMIVIGSFGVAAIAVIVITGHASVAFEALLARLAEKGSLTRGEYWERAIDTWKCFPIFGCGYDTSYFYNYTTFWPDGGDHLIWIYMAFHNSYLSFLAENGTWGVLLFGGAVISRVAAFWRRFWFERKREKFSIFMLACFMMLDQACQAYTESFLFSVGSTEAFVFWMLFTWGIVYLEKLPYAKQTAIQTLNLPSYMNAGQPRFDSCQKS